MPAYTKVGPFTNGGAPGINKAFLDGVENQLAAAPYSTFFLTTPYHLTTNPTVNNGSSTDLTCTGGSTGVPSGAKGVLLNIGLYSVTAPGGTADIKPTGASDTSVRFGGPVQNQFTAGFAIAPLSAGGQITVTASGANIVLQDWYIFGYIY